MSNDSAAAAEPGESISRPSFADAEHIAFVAARTPVAQAALETLEAIYPSKPPTDADVIVALGGDGFMLQTIHRFMAHGKPIYGMNRGSVGFLMNPFKSKNLLDRYRVRFGMGPILWAVLDLGGRGFSYPPSRNPGT